MSCSVARFIELVLSPRERDGADATALQRLALEILRDQRPGMLIDHIEETTGEGTSPARAKAVLTRLRSHAEARTFDELRVFEIGRLIRPEDPNWHQTVIDLVRQARAVVLDSSGLIADPANPEGVRASPAATPGRAAAEPPRVGARSAEGRAPSSHPPPREPASPTAARNTAGAEPREAASTRWEPRRPPAGAVGTSFTVLCEGRAYCEICGQALTIQSLGHERKRYYACATLHLHPPSDCQPEVAFPVESVDQVVWQRITSTLDPVGPALEALRNALSRDQASGEGRRTQHRERLERLERDEIEILGLRAEDRISENAARRRLNEISRERRALEEHLQDGSDLAEPLKPLIKVIEEVLPDGVPAQAVPPADRRRLLLAAFPDAAEYGVQLLANGEIRIHSILDDHDLRPTMRHKAQAIGAAMQGIRERVGEISPQRPVSAVTSFFGSFRERIRRARVPTRLPGDVGTAPGKLSFSRTTRISRARLAAYGMALIAAILIAVVLRPTPVDSSPSDNLVDQVGMAEQLLELYRVPGGWMGRTSPTWVGATDAALTLDACRTLAGRLAPGLRETITLLRPEGVPIVECGPPVD